jgi:AcrR family transcriptional regulator
VSNQVKTRRERRKQETRERIRTVAIELFSEQGYEATKVGEICAEADVARQTFFNHYATKSAVLEETLRVGLDFVEAQMNSACERGATTRERIGFFFGGLVSAAVTVGPFARDLVAHILKINQDELAARHRDRVSGFFLAIVRSGLSQGDVTRSQPPEALASLCEGALMALFASWGAGVELDAEERAAQLADLVAAAIERRPGE